VSSDELRRGEVNVLEGDDYGFDSDCNNDVEEDHEDNQDELHLQIPPPDESLLDSLDIDVDQLLSFIRLIKEEAYSLR